MKVIKNEVHLVNIKRLQVDNFEPRLISTQSQFLVVFDGLALERLL